MGRKITWCKHCRQVISFEKHDPHHHEHDRDHNHKHTADHDDHNVHEHDHEYHDECNRCKTKGSWLKGT